MKDNPAEVSSRSDGHPTLRQIVAPLPEVSVSLTVNGSLQE